MCTVDRTSEPEQFLQSLSLQTYRDFELIIVDQNEDDRIRRLADAYRNEFAITVFRSERGLSRARNVALQHLEGGIVGFPDDDCTYPDDLLEGVAKRFTANSDWQGLAVRRTDHLDRKFLAGAPIRLTRHNLWGRVPSISLFVRKEPVKRIGTFDETLGAGSGTGWGAGEDTDFVLRALDLGIVWYQDPSLAVLHPPALRTGGPQGRARARLYARGLGRVLRKNALPAWMVLGGCGLSIGRSLGAIARGKLLEADWHLQTLIGRIQGWMDSVNYPPRGHR